MFGLTFQQMRVLKEAVGAWNQKDLNGVVKAVAPLLPSFPTDGRPRTDSPLRWRFHAAITNTAGLVPAMQSALHYYIDEASDEQLAMARERVQSFVERLYAPDEP